MSRTYLRRGSGVSPVVPRPPFGALSPAPVRSGRHRASSWWGSLLNGTGESYREAVVRRLGINEGTAPAATVTAPSNRLAHHGSTAARKITAGGVV